MTVAIAEVGVHAKCSFTVGGGTAVTIKNSDWSLKRMGNVKEANNTTDGRLRTVGLPDASGSVKGSVDTSQRIEVDVVEGSIGILKLYTDGTKFFSLTAIIDNLNIETGVDNVENWSFDFMLQSGTVTNPV